MEDVKFHQCVRLSRFENDRTISFIPPDGEFELMSYRLSTQVKPLVWVEASVESHRGSRVEYMVKVRGQFKRRSTANNVEIYVPVPDDADSPKFRVCHFLPLFGGFDGAGRGRISGVCTGEVGVCLEDQTTRRWSRLSDESPFWITECQKWCVPPLLKGTDLLDEADKRPPISVKFEIPYFTVSGIQVRYLKIVEKSGYQALPWVRYITQVRLETVRALS